MYKKLKAVCFGGGTGLPALLSNLKDNPWLYITAVVNVTDNGGSSGELRDRFGMLPPGDVLKCLLALSQQEGAREILLKRIRNTEVPGHTGGNILLLGLEKVYGSFTGAIDALGQLLSIQGSVVPVAVDQSVLCADYTDGTCNKGEMNVDLGVREGKRISRLFLEPHVDVSTQAQKAIHEADVFCVGPGSFYTSVLPNFLPTGVSDAMRESNGKIIYIANLLTEGKGMERMTLDDLVATAEEYIGRRVDHVVANRHLPGDAELLERYAGENKYPLVQREAETDPRFISANLWLDKTIARHDSARLAHAVFGLINGSTL